MRISARRRRRQGGNEIIEFAVIASLLVPMFLWVFINGMNLIRLIQCTQICRDIGNLYMQGIDFSTYAAQQIAARVSLGYGLQIGSGYTGNSSANDSNSGNGWIVLSEVMYAGASACSVLPQNVTCTNQGKYVYLMRLDFGNKSVTINGTAVQSGIGNPASATINSEGFVQNYLTDSSAVATNAGNYITLGDTQVAYVAETFFASPVVSFSAYPNGGIVSRTFF